MSFQQDLKTAQAVESEVQNKYILSGYTASTTASLGQFSAYDLVISSGGTQCYTLEVKYDNKAPDTQNVAIEIEKVNPLGGFLPSGLSITEADYQVYKIDGVFYIIPTENLKNILKDLNREKVLIIVLGGDNKKSRLALMSFYTFKKECEIL
ncbi:hypothetical protein [Pedobacter gandavensis]|uniref:hypothetical protein n=1 Tax=Pedobacter gandavensis TaxID=2679963 RepID=UPI002930AAED|nr:hypothetical protein [Pedobacter gandavensis]